VLNLLHNKNRLGDSMQTVPPPIHDVLGEPSKEKATSAHNSSRPHSTQADVPPDATIS
jgi:NADH-quinone oxidoreductase subunit I